SQACRFLKLQHTLYSFTRYDKESIIERTIHSMLRRTELKVSMTIIFPVEKKGKKKEEDVNYNISQTGLICSSICIIE
ncbi:MAG TPA: hypothetical protein VFY68_05465, partial [Nitrososphaeraceae archaeon]|nr:hypothetical protein [Nitrososphaeraceae archaeon]